MKFPKIKMNCNKSSCKDTRSDLRELKLAYARLQELYWQIGLKECGYCETTVDGHLGTCDQYNKR